MSKGMLSNIEAKMSVDDAKGCILIITDQWAQHKQHKLFTSFDVCFLGGCYVLFLFCSCFSTDYPSCDVLGKM